MLFQVKHGMGRRQATLSREDGKSMLQAVSFIILMKEKITDSSYSSMFPSGINIIPFAMYGIH